MEQPQAKHSPSSRTVNLVGNEIMRALLPNAQVNPRVPHKRVDNNPKPRRGTRRVEPLVRQRLVIPLKLRSVSSIPRIVVKRK